MESTYISAPAGVADVRLGFATLDREVRLDALPVEGALPPWLTGTLYRNGPARFAIGAERYRHWFDGLAMVHGFTLAGGGVSYANRYLRTPAFLESERTARIARSEFATDPQRTLFERAGAVFGGTASSNNANVNIVPFRDAYLALTETPGMVEFDGETLETRGVLGYDDAVPGQITTAHTHHDPVRRATFNVVIEVARKSCYRIVRIADGTLHRTVVATIAVDEPAYLHAFSTTERYVIIAEYPLVARPLDMLLRRKPYIDNYRWKPQRATRFHVVDKDSGASAGSFETGAFFAFHHANAYDDGDSVVLDVCAYDDASIVDEFRLANLTASSQPHLTRARLRRYRLIPGRTAAEIEPLANAALELPQIAAARAAREYRYTYGVDGSADGVTAFERLVKVDLRAPNTYPGEPVFVARPGAADEDDGALLSVVLDARSATSALVVLDARTLAECARARLPHHIPFGFHGMFRNRN
jgi:carotenoid cleavage dioxygenase-like enzyme